ncbi:UNVERIFIED_CONTAM: hypothetical protein Sradi_2992200 [Sesamum radiatum]|uniref:Uncharacterized protein n=1 Tax=Sesamum radiatum TaxID=300843 RepID=A0AAW2S0N3_SESRA
MEIRSVPIFLSKPLSLPLLLPQNFLMRQVFFQLATQLPSSSTICCTNWVFHECLQVLFKFFDTTPHMVKSCFIPLNQPLSDTTSTRHDPGTRITCGITAPKVLDKRLTFNGPSSHCLK